MTISFAFPHSERRDMRSLASLSGELTRRGITFRAS